MARRKLKRTLVVIVLAAGLFFVYVEIANINSRQMTTKQKLLKAIYPIFSGLNRLLGTKTRILDNKANINPVKRIYDLSVRLNNGTSLSLDSLQGKKILFVNTASDCGYTGQYMELQKLYQQYQDKLVIIGFPANDFHEQEKRSDEEIATFCSINYGVSFPLAAKSVVVKNGRQNEIFRWLTDKTRNGWNDQPPSWNFTKYLVNEKGVLTAYFDPAVSPLSEEVLNSIK